MIIRKTVVASLSVLLTLSVVACGSDPTPTAAPKSNAQQVVAGDEDAVEADGTITLSSREIRTCKDFVTQAGRVHENMSAMAGSGSTGEGWASYTAGMPGWLNDLTLEMKAATTPQFVGALGQTLQGGQDALVKVSGGTAPEDTDYDPALIAGGLTDLATLCESAGINITWHA